MIISEILKNTRRPYTPKCKLINIMYQIATIYSQRLSSNLQILSLRDQGDSISKAEKEVKTQLPVIFFKVVIKELNILND